MPESGAGAANDGAASIDRDVRAHASHFAGMEKAVFEDCFGDHGSAFGLRRQRHILRLHVGGETGILLGDDVGGNELVSIMHAQRRSIWNFHGHAGGFQFRDYRAKWSGVAIGDGEIAIRDGPSD